MSIALRYYLQLVSNNIHTQRLAPRDCILRFHEGWGIQHHLQPCGAGNFETGQHQSPYQLHVEIFHCVASAPWLPFKSVWKSSFYAWWLFALWMPMVGFTPLIITFAPGVISLMASIICNFHWCTVRTNFPDSRDERMFSKTSWFERTFHPLNES